MKNITREYISFVPVRNMRIPVKIHLHPHQESWIGIEDLNGEVSVTNAIEEIVTHVHQDFSLRHCRFFQWGGKESVFEVTFKSNFSNPVWKYVSEYDDNPFFYDVQKIMEII